MGSRLTRVLLLALFAGCATDGAASDDGTLWTENSVAALSTADKLQQGHRWSEAISHYKKALELSARPPAIQKYIVYNNIGWCACPASRVRPCLPARASPLGLTAPRPQHRSHFHMGEHAAAEEHYHMALAVMPSAPPTDHAFINLATLYKAEGASRRRAPRPAHTAKRRRLMFAARLAARRLPPPRPPLPAPQVASSR